MPVLLAQDPYGRKWPMSSVSKGVFGEPGRLYATIERASGSVEGGKETEGPAEESEAK